MISDHQPHQAIEFMSGACTFVTPRPGSAQNIIEVALSIAAKGLPVFPCRGSKAPIFEGGFKTASTDPSTIQHAFSHPQAELVGVPTGAVSGFDVLDFDPRHGSDKWKQANLHLLPETRVHKTPGWPKKPGDPITPGEHWLLRHAAGVRNDQSGLIGPGIDVRGDGGYIIMPPSPGYSVISDVAIAAWPPGLLARALKPEKPARPAAQSRRQADQSEGKRYQAFVARILDNVRAAVDGSKHDVLLKQARVLGGVTDAAGIGEDEAVAWLLDALPDNVVDWTNARQTALDGLRHGRANPIELEDRPPPNGSRRPAPSEAEAEPNVSKSEPPSPESDPPKRKRTLNALTLVNFIATHPKWKNAVRINLFTETIQVSDPFPPVALTEACRTFRDPADLLKALLWFQATGFAKAGKNLVWDALAATAYDNAYHPVRDYLDSLKWDGTERLGRMFQHYFNAEAPDDKTVAYLEHISLCFGVSAVARIHEPGCKVDHMPVLVGPQGYHKSQAIRALCQDPAWFSDDLSPDLVERDTKESLVGKWLIELAELPHVRKEVERVKAFFSRQTDRYRRAYDRATNDWPRQCVFMASSNDLEFIDVTGNRRFWPIEIARPIDVSQIVADRDQLWGEAVALYETGHQWWLAPSIEALAAEQQARFEEEDLWTSAFGKWATGRTAPFTLAAAMCGALGISDPTLITKADQMRGSKCLKSLGYKRRKQRCGSQTEWTWQ